MNITDAQLIDRDNGRASLSVDDLTAWLDANRLILPTTNPDISECKVVTVEGLIERIRAGVWTEFHIAEIEEAVKEVDRRYPDRDLDNDQIRRRLPAKIDAMVDAVTRFALLFDDLSPGERRIVSDSGYRESAKVIGNRMARDWRARIEAAIGAGKLKGQDVDPERQTVPNPQADAKSLPWWQCTYDIKTLAQNIGAKLHEKGGRTSNSAIAKEIAKRIRDLERGKGTDRSAPDWDTIRGYLTGWKFKPD